jgi:Asp/Glu/hydantoin racemase
MAPTRIVLLHATCVAIPPISDAFARDWPEAETVNLLDDSLSPDRASEPELTTAMIERFVMLGHYAHAIGADGILVTCSAFGPAIERLAADLPIPVVKPNEAMFSEALAAGRRIGMLATFKPSIGTMETEFRAFVDRTEHPATLTTLLVDGAMDRLRAGDPEAHNRLVAERAPELAELDAVMLAHFSTSTAAEAVRRRVGIPVLTSPSSAVRQMKSLVMGG